VQYHRDVAVDVAGNFLVAGNLTCYRSPAVLLVARRDVTVLQLAALIVAVLVIDLLAVDADVHVVAEVRSSDVEEDEPVL